MFKREYAVLIMFVAVVLALPAMAFSAEKTDKDAILQELVASMDKNPDMLRNAVFQTGDEYMRQNKTDETIALYEKALKALPDNEDLMTRLANMYSQKQAYKSSADIYKRLTELKPENAFYFNMLSDAYRNAGDNEKAAGVWKDILAKRPDDAGILSQAANFYSSINDMDNAILLTEKLTKLEPSNAEYQRMLAEYYSRTDKIDKAEAAYNKIIETAKELWQKESANMGLLDIYQKQNKMDDAAKSYEAALQKNPNDISKYKILAELYMRKGDNAKVLDIYERAVKADPNDSDVANRLVDAYESNGKLDQAIAQVQKLMQANPNDTFLMDRLSNIYERAGKKEDAKKAWEALMAKGTNDVGLYGRYADALNRMGDTNGAIAQLKKAQQLDLNNMYYTLRMTEVLAANNQQDEAKAILTKLMNEAKDNYIKEDAKRRLEQIDELKNMPSATSGAEGAPMPMMQPPPVSEGAYTPITPPVQQTTVSGSLPVPPKQNTIKKKRR
nr:tetratricopeptide repeat protein [Candidatus Omnitrophota bacterium]